MRATAYGSGAPGDQPVVARARPRLAGTGGATAQGDTPWF